MTQGVPKAVWRWRTIAHRMGDWLRVLDKPAMPSAGGGRAIAATRPRCRPRLVGEPALSMDPENHCKILYNYWLTKRIPPWNYGGGRILRADSTMNMNVTRRIMAVGAVGVFGLVLVGVLYFYGLWVQDGFRAASDDAERIAGTALKLQVDLLDARRLEKDFLLRRELVHVTRHLEVSRDIESSLSSLRESAQTLEQSEL